MSGVLVTVIPRHPATSRAGVRPGCAGPDLNAAKPPPLAGTCLPGVPTEKPCTRGVGELLG